MNFFSRIYHEGPGISENVKIQGIRLFGLIVKEKFLKLILLNIVFVLCSLPIITIAPAVKAMSKVTMDMVRGIPASPISNFFGEFKRNFIKTSIYGTGLLVFIVSMIYSTALCITASKDFPSMWLISGVNFFILLYLLAVVFYSLKAWAVIDLPLKTIIKNSLKLVAITPGKLFKLLLLVILPTFLLATQWIIGFPFLFLWQFSINSLILSIVGWDVIDTYIVKK